MQGAAVSPYTNCPTTPHSTLPSSSITDLFTSLSRQYVASHLPLQKMRLVEYSLVHRKLFPSFKSILNRVTHDLTWNPINTDNSMTMKFSRPKFTWSALGNLTCTTTGSRTKLPMGSSTFSGQVVSKIAKTNPPSLIFHPIINWWYRSIFSNRWTWPAWIHKCEGIFPSIRLTITPSFSANRPDLFN